MLVQTSLKKIITSQVTNDYYPHILYISCNFKSDTAVDIFIVMYALNFHWLPIDQLHSTHHYYLCLPELASAR